MVGKCCGQGVAPLSQYKEANKRCVKGSHDEEVCHGTGERRRDLIDQLKIFLDEFDERPCQVPPPQGLGTAKPLGQYPDYMKKHCQSWMPPNPRPPTITSVQIHEVRPTEDIKNMQYQNTEYISYSDARSKPPPSTCDCVKRNGLQDKCPRPECKPPTPQCLATNPGPCCPPSMGLTSREAAQERQDYIDTQQDSYTSSTHHYYKPGMKMVCFCRGSPSATPGKKYMCCPAPE